MVIPSNLSQLVNSYSLAVWIFYGLVFVGLLIMRVTHRDVKRPYKVSAYVNNMHMYCTETIEKKEIEIL